MQLSFLESVLATRGPSETEAFFSLQQSLTHARIHRVVSCDEMSGGWILELRLESDSSSLTISCRAPSLWPGQRLTLQKVDSEFEILAVDEPTTPRALKKFLKSGPLGCLGKTTTDSLSSRLAGRLLKTIEFEPQKLLEIEGIGRKRLIDIVQRFQAFREREKIAVFLFNESLPLDWLRPLWRTHATDAVEAFKKDPYSAIKSHGFSFELVDQFALRNGIPADDIERRTAALDEIIRLYSLRGHCACPDTLLVNEAASKLKIDKALIEEALELTLIQERLVIEMIGGQPCIYDRAIWNLEKDVAEKCLALSETPAAHSFIQPAKSVAWAQRFLDLELSPNQKRAVETVLSSSLSVVTGGPGTGKTTLVRCLVTTLNSQHVRFALCAPTGRAAQRLRETTGVQAATLHRLLKFDGRTGVFSHDAARPLELDIVLVDEASMLDLALMSHLLNALPSGCALVLIGDAHQLPSVGSGAVLQSLISSKRFPVVELTDLFRQSADSGIRLNAERVHLGLMPTNASSRKKDFQYIQVRTDQEARDQVRQLLFETLPRDYGIHDLNQVQVLTPTNRGHLGALELNQQIRQMIEVDRKADSGFGIGDKVIVTKNDYLKNVFNGDIGHVVRADDEKRLVEVDFGERQVVFHSEEISTLALAYAISIHKSQGSEYRAVIILIADAHLSIAQRHLVYTAITRGKEVVFLVADPRALRTAISKSEKRWQRLTELLEN